MNKRSASVCSKFLTAQALWQMQGDALLGLPDLAGDLEQLGDDGRWLGLRQRGMLQGLGAQLLMQDVGGGMQQHAHAIGDETGARGAVGSQIGFQMFNEIFRLAAGALDVLVQRTGIESDERSDDEARILALRHHFRFQQHSPGLWP